MGGGASVKGVDRLEHLPGALRLACGVEEVGEVQEA